MEQFQIYCGGKFLTTKNPLNVVNPYSGEIFAQTFLAGAEELETAILAAQKIQKEMKEFPSRKKFNILREISDAINANRERLAVLLCRESGKPMRYALGEIDRAAQTFLVAAEESKRLPKEYISLDWTMAGDKKEGVINYFPIGIVAGIAPFNFPLNLA